MADGEYSLEARLRARARRQQREDAAFRQAYPAAVGKAWAAEKKLRRQYSLPPEKLVFPSPDDFVMRSTQSDLGRRAGEAPKVDKAFFFMKAEKGNRTVPLVQPDTAQLTATSWDIGGVTPANMGCYSPAAPLDAPPRKTGTSGLPGYFDTDYGALCKDVWSPQA